MEAADTVGPLNNFINSSFTQVLVPLNGTMTTGKYLPFRRYIENLLSYGHAAKEVHLTIVRYSTKTMQENGPTMSG